MKKSNQLGTRLRSLREHRSLTQSQLAERAGCGAPFISMLERGGRSDISYRLAARIAQALGVTVRELMEGRAMRKDITVAVERSMPKEPKDIAVAVVVERSIPEEPKDIAVAVERSIPEEPKDIAVVVERSIPEEPKDITIRVAKTSRGKRR